MLAAAKVGGIMANIQSPAEFLYDNLAIQNNIIECSRVYGVKKLLFLASSCIFRQPADDGCAGLFRPPSAGDEVLVTAVSTIL